MHKKMLTSMTERITAKLPSGVANKFTAKLFFNKHVDDPCFQTLMFHYRLFKFAPHTTVPCKIRMTTFY